MLPGCSLFRLFFMKPQNSSISAIRSTETRIASESVESFNAFLARRRVPSSIKKDLLLSLTCLGTYTSQL